MGLVFSPLDLETIDVRYRDRSFRPAVPHTISRHTHRKARPEIPDPAPAVTGIDYLPLTAAAHHEQLRDDERIGYHALYGAQTQIPAQLSLTELTSENTYADIAHEGGVSA